MAEWGISLMVLSQKWTDEGVQGFSLVGLCWGGRSSGNILVYMTLPHSDLMMCRVTRRFLISARTNYWVHSAARAAGRTDITNGAWRDGTQADKRGAVVSSWWLCKAEVINPGELCRLVARHGVTTQRSLLPKPIWVSRMQWAVPWQQVRG